MLMFNNSHSLASHWSGNKTTSMKPCDRHAPGTCPYGDECWFMDIQNITLAPSHSDLHILPDTLVPPLIVNASKYEPPHRKIHPTSSGSSFTPFGSPAGSVHSSSHLCNTRSGALTPMSLVNPPSVPLLTSDKACFHFARSGTCPKGDLCAFKHDANVIPANFVKHFDPKSHPSYRTKPCYAWLYGTCQKGEDCTFKHERPATPCEVPTVASTADPSDPSQLPPNYRTSDCKWFNSPGGCWYGNTCKFRHSPVFETASSKEDPKHPFYRTRPCAFFQRGACPKGDNCNYLHDSMPKGYKAGSTISSMVLVASPKPEKLDLPSSPPPLQSVSSSKCSSSGSTQDFFPYHSRTSSSISSTETAVEHVADGDPKLLDDELLEAYVDDDDVIVYIPPRVSFQS